MPSTKKKKIAPHRLEKNPLFLPTNFCAVIKRICIHAIKDTIGG